MKLWLPSSRQFPVVSSMRSADRGGDPMSFARAATIAGILAVLFVLSPSTASAGDSERRIALVIGVSAYQNAPHLVTPINDARAIGDSLRRLKFDVIELYDPDFRDLNSGVRAFGIRAASAD